MGNHDKKCVSLKGLAERELGAFIQAVSDIYGPEQATISAADWIDELEFTDAVLELTNRDLRLISIAAATRLAGRLMAFNERTPLTQLTKI